MLYDYTTVTPASVEAQTDAALAAADALVAGLLASATSPIFCATLLPLELAGAELSTGYGRGTFMGQAHPDPEVRDVGTEAEERINKWRVALVARSDVYRAVRAFAVPRVTGRRRPASGAFRPSVRVSRCRSSAASSAPESVDPPHGSTQRAIAR